MGKTKTVRSGLKELPCLNCPEIAKVKKHPYRVFISYSHQDRKLAAKLDEHLRSEGLFPITDHQIRVGEAFSEEIREMIECSHVFMPLVTPSANERLWVQQEIGYAAALNVPVCPVAVGNLPSGMAEHIQGVHIGGAEGVSPSAETVMSVVKQRLTYPMLHDLVRRARLRPRQGRYDCTLYWTSREELLVNLTEAAYRDGCKLINSRKNPGDVDRDVWRLRQCSAFGSFSIPDAGVANSDWDVRDADRYRSQYERRLLRRERQVMEAYTRCFGCDLIIDPRISVKEPFESQRESGSGEFDYTRFKHSALRTAFRIKLIIEFIEQYKKDDRLRIVLPAKPGRITANLVIVGDWFSAEAVVPFYLSGGYERTMFTRHAPTVLNRINSFNQDFRDHLAEAKIDPSSPGAVLRAKEAALGELRLWHEQAVKETGGGVAATKKRRRSPGKPEKKSPERAPGKSKN